MFISLALILGTKCVSLALVSESGHVSSVLGSGMKMFLSLALVSDPGCVSFSGFGFRVRVLSDWLVSCSSWPFNPTSYPLEQYPFLLQFFTLSFHVASG